MSSPSVRLATLTDADAEPTARWREAARANLRTPYVRTVEEQREFIRSLPAHRYEYRYWALRTDDFQRLGIGDILGIAGLSPIQWENGLTEVSLVLDPACIGKGYGGQALRLLLSEAFDHLRMTQVVAEVYQSNPALGFWEHQAAKWGATRVVLPDRKFYDLKYHDAIYFAFQWKAKTHPAPTIKQHCAYCASLGAKADHAPDSHDRGIS